MKPILIHTNNNNNKTAREECELVLHEMNIPVVQWFYITPTNSKMYEKTTFL